ncbi:MAG: 50S ribosomal protein L10 [Candidatus Omnitrophota bacterium]|nr:50S ribosomal protein L10 [Candidatus Omnitrophota bacterium]
MKKLGLIFKESSENLIKNRFSSSVAIFIVRYSGVSGLELNNLRLSLKAAKASFFVAKNSVARRALEGVGMSSLLEAIEGPSGLVFAKEDGLSVSKVLCDFSKTHEQLKIEAGSLKDKILKKEDIERLAKLPSMEVLRAQVVVALNSPLQQLAMVLNGVLRKFVYCLEQVKNKKLN